MYREARIKSRMTVEEAAWRLHIGVRSLYRYESGEQQTPADVVRGMVETYGDTELAYMHCTQMCPLGRIFGCPVAQKNTAPGAA